MKKIGILHGKERTFPQAFVERVNELKEPGITAEPVTINQVIQGDPTGYAVILDRISQDVPFYRAYLKNAALNGTAVINNPFWWSADEKFFNNCLATKLGVAVPSRSPTSPTRSIGRASSRTSAGPRTSSPTRAAAGRTSTRSVTSMSSSRPTPRPTSS